MVDRLANGRTGVENAYMLVEGARARMEESSDRTTQARDGIEAAQGGGALGALAKIVGGVLTKGGAKGGGGGKGF